MQLYHSCTRSTTIAHAYIPFYDPFLSMKRWNISRTHFILFVPSIEFNFLFPSRWSRGCTRTSKLHTRNGDDAITIACLYRWRGRSGSFGPFNLSISRQRFVACTVVHQLEPVPISCILSWSYLLSVLHELLHDLYGHSSLNVTFNSRRLRPSADCTRKSNCFSG